MITKEKVKSQIYKYGYYPALCFLKQEQDLENFENCVEIKAALDEIGKGREWYLKSSLDPKDMEQTLERILRLQQNPELIKNNMPYYIKQFNNIKTNNNE